MRIHEESRTSTAVVDPTSGEQTEINERGPSVTEAELELFVDKLLYLAKGAGVCVFCGSLPGGVDTEPLRPAGRRAAQLGVTTVLDAEGEPLRLATRAGPDVVTPNELEAEELVGHEFADDEDRATAVAEIVDAGRPRGGHDLARRLPGPARRRRRRHQPAPAAAGPRWTRWSRSRRSARATPSWPASWPPATAAARRTTACASRVACGAESTQHFGAGVLDPREVERLQAEVEHRAGPAPEARK